MRTLRRFLLRVFNLLARRRADERLREEIECHIATQTEENIRGGMTAEEANRRARMKFGGFARVSEDYSAEAGLPFFENVALDVRYALRVLRKSPAFTAVALVTLMLGIGANIAVFGVLNSVLLQPPGVNDPGSLYQLRHKPWASFRLLTMSYPAFEDFRKRNTTFSGMLGVYGYSRALLRQGNTVLNVSGDEVTGNYFDLLGVQPQAGRFFHAADENGPNSAPYVVLSDALWRRAFQSERHVVGTVVYLNRHPFTVVGVAPPEFHGMERFVWPDYWLPMVNQAQVEGSDYLHSRTAITVTAIGRLKPGLTPQQATENLDAIAADLATKFPETDDGQPLRLIHPGLYGDEGEVIRGFLWSVTALALLVLGAACANLTTLFAARAADRRRELALRAALGSSRQRLVRQLMTEALMLSATGGTAGLAAACLLMRLLSRWNSPYGQLAVSVDARVYLAAMVLTLVSALLFGIMPARQAWQSTPLQMIQRSGVMDVRRFALRDVLLGAQIAICTLLVTAALVAARGMLRVLDVPLGFRPVGAVLVDLDLNQAEHADRAEAERARKVLDAVRSISGVTAAGLVNRTPMTGGVRGIPIFRPGVTEFRIDRSALSAYVYRMSPAYLEAAGTRLTRGRDISWHDAEKTPYVAVVNETFARRMWGTRPALGEHFVVRGKLTEVVGVAEDGKYHDIAESPAAAVYLALAQSEPSDTVLVVRSERAAGQLAGALERTLRGVEPNAGVTVQNWADTLAPVLFPARTATVALGAMGLLAAMLAVTGIFGMAAYGVSRRTKELGIRVALGARRMQVLRAAVGRPAMLLVFGSALGLAAGMFATRLLRHIVYRADPAHPAVVGGVAFTMAVLGIAASAVPAARALAIDASQSMRDE